MFHTNLKNKRLLNNLSQKQVADFLNISHQSISKWENGEALPSIEYLPKLAEYMNCNIDDFFAKETEEIFEYTTLNEYFFLMSQSFHDITDMEDVICFIQKNPGILEKARAFCESLQEHKLIKTKYVQSVLMCSGIEAKAFLNHLIGCEMIEECDDTDTYIVVNHVVEGMLPLLKLQSEICILCKSKHCKVEKNDITISIA